jgi:two-component system chemotaxis sensor kinase CheA
LIVEMRRYKELFLAEAREHLVAAFELVGSLETEVRDPAAWTDLLRHAHSMKGMSATMGFDSLVALAHALEEFAGQFEVLDAEDLRRGLGPIADGLACMSRIVDRVDKDEPPRSVRAEALAEELEGALRNAVRDQTPVECAAAPAVLTRAEAPTTLDRSAPHWRLDLLLDDLPARSAELTVQILGQLAAMGRVEQVDPPGLDLQTGRFEGRLGLILSSELSRETLERRLRGIAGLQGCSLAPASRPEARSAPIAPIRWVRVRAEQLDALVDGLQELRFEQARLRRSLPADGRAGLQHLERAELCLKKTYGDALELRLVPFDTVAHRLHQAVRDLERQLGKDVRFEISGGQVRLDRSMLDELVEPLLHLVRNAMDHGLEQPEERRARGKAPRCSLMLELERRGERVYVRLSDDGRGIDPDAIARAAVRAGMVTERAVSRMSREERLFLTTRTGFSTAESVSHLSGRGVGLDVVRDTVERLGGSLLIESAPGGGTRVSIEIPLRIALAQTLLVRSGGEYYALPMEAVERAIDENRGAGRFAAAPDPDAAGQSPERVRLQSSTGDAPESPGDPCGGWIVVLGIGSRRLGLVVDEVLGRRELVVKPLRPPLSQLRPFSGASVLEDGAIALVVDPLQLRPS